MKKTQILIAQKSTVYGSIIKMILQRFIPDAEITNTDELAIAVCELLHKVNIHLVVIGFEFGSSSTVDAKMITDAARDKMNVDGSPTMVLVNSVYVDINPALVQRVCSPDGMIGKPINLDKFKAMVLGLLEDPKVPLKVPLIRSAEQAAIL